MKRNIATALLLLLLCAALLSCLQIVDRHQRAPTYPENYTHELPRDYSATWNALVNTLVEDLRLSLDKLDEKKGFIRVNEELVPIGRYCDCGGYTGTASRTVTIDLKRLGEKKTSITITARYTTSMELKNNLGQVVKTRRIKCPSTGRVEEEIVWNLKRRLDL